jgi:hypothetical protein
MTVGLTDPVPSNNKVTLSITTPSDSDISSLLVLQDTSPITDTPVEGVTYATSSKVGTSDVTCAFTVSASTTYSCATSYNVFNGIPYYFKVFMRDSRGNYSEGITYATSTTPNRVTTLGTGIDTSSSTLSIGGSATTSDTFTLISDYSSDPISSITITFASSTATSTSLVEITNDAGAIVYGSTSTPSSDNVTITTSGLYATTVQTQYRIRITPKSHATMPAPPGASYALTTYVSSFVSSVAGPLHTGSDYASTTITIDNGSPADVKQEGVDWVTRAAAGNNDYWSAVTYGNGLFVAVGSGDGGAGGDRVMTSSDGITWTPQSAANNNSWNTVAYGNGIFVALSCGTSCGASSNNLMTSPDGIVWTPGSPAGGDDAWSGVTYANGIFVAVGGGGDRVMTSSNGTAYDFFWWGGERLHESFSEIVLTTYARALQAMAKLIVYSLSAR